MRKTTGARECSRIERSGVDAGERKEKAARPQRGKAQQGKRKRHGPERQRHSKAAHSQENRNAQQERGVVERRSENLQNVERSMVEY